MKKVCTILMILFGIGGLFKVQSQNVYFFYDFGSLLYEDCASRPMFTTTVDLFHADKWGSTFFFVDMDYTAKGISKAYWEINRTLKFWEAPVSLSLEYDGGLTRNFSFSNAYLGGVQYGYENEDFSKGFALTLFYKYIQGNFLPHNFQFTGTWHLDFGHNAATFTGFVDVWSEPQPGERDDFVFQSEPQLWYHFNSIKGVNEKFNLSIGSEIEFSYNLVLPDRFLVIPTVALKWKFK